MAMMTDTGRGGLGEKSVFWLILAMGVGVFIVLAVAMMLNNSVNSVKTDPTTQSEVAQDPTGAGANPDGVADEATEGLMNATASDDLIDSSTAASTDPMANAEADGDGQETSATAVEPATGDGENVDQMIQSTAGTEEDGSDAMATENTAATDSSDATTNTSANEDGSDPTAPELVVDPDNGYNGTDPDGGAAPFVPTPSGPEGRDDDPLTSN